jgi:hypothetical protein
MRRLEPYERWCYAFRMGGGQRRKRKNAAAASLAHRRWLGTTAEERSEAGRKAVQARWAKARARRDAGGSDE